MVEKARILVVDDEGELCRILDLFLTAQGYAVVTANDGESAVAVVGKGKYDLVLLDCRLPDMSGIEVLRHIKRMDENIPVVIMTGYGTMKEATEAMRSGACNYITKPFDFDSLKLLVEDLCNGAAVKAQGEEAR